MISRCIQNVRNVQTLSRYWRYWLGCSKYDKWLPGTRTFLFRPFITFTDDSGLSEELVNQRPSSNIMMKKYFYELSKNLFSEIELCVPVLSFDSRSTTYISYIITLMLHLENLFNRHICKLIFRYE